MTLRDLGGRPFRAVGRIGHQDFSEKRRHPRRSVPVRCWIADGKSTLYARVHDVSLGGFCVHAPVSFTPGSEVEIALVETSGELGAPTGSVAVRARGRVVWVSTGGDRRLGARFTDFVVGEHRLFELIG